MVKLIAHESLLLTWFTHKLTLGHKELILSTVNIRCNIDLSIP